MNNSINMTTTSPKKYSSRLNFDIVDINFDNKNIPQHNKTSIIINDIFYQTKAYQI